jgi:ppGpp synthetase/RelA/SpoT-type nucleotidyltranferase
MKIAKPIRDAFDHGEALYIRLKQEVRDILKPRVEDRGWFYRDRVKGLESFALKVETGRFPDYARMEDFFACTVIVPTFSHLPEAIELISGPFEVVERRPKVDAETHKNASDFTFDELRLYVKVPPAADRPPSGFEDLVFEIQIKTILQYAWGVATHDLIYKTDEVSWPKERIAYQVKAMLEHAELAIAEAGQLSRAPAVSRQDKRTKDILKAIEQLRAIWTGSDMLPSDLKRLAQSIVAVLRAGDIAVERLTDILSFEQRRIGLLPIDLSPYSFVIQALANHPDLNFESSFKREHIRTKLVVHEGMDLPASMREPHTRIIVLQVVAISA